MKQKRKRARPSEPATIREIARLAKVSIGTVDRVVHNRGRVAPETERRVRRVIRELGYKPNIYASHLSRAKTYHFGVVIPRRDQDSTFWQTSVIGVEKAVRELHHFRVRVKYFYFDRYAPAQFKRTAARVLDAGLDGLLIAPVISEPVESLIQQLPEGFPLVFINTTMDGITPLSFIGQDSRQSGLVCGRLLHLLAPRPSTVAVILTVPDDHHIRERADGFEEAFRGVKGISVKEYELYDLDHPDHSRAALGRLLGDNPDLAGIFVANVAVHYVAEYLKNHKRQKKKIFLIGYDLIRRNIDLLNQDSIDFLISQKPERQSYEGIYALYRATALKEKVEKKVMMPIDIITKENVGFYETS
jgi:LacI family transcriptional regulator